MSSCVASAGSIPSMRSSNSPTPVLLIAETAVGSTPSSQNAEACASPLTGLSHLFTASTKGLSGCLRRSQVMMSSSAVVSPTWPSMTTISIVASATAAAACCSIMPGSTSAPPASAARSRRDRRVAPAASPGSCISPPVSMNISSRPLYSARV